MKIHKEVAMPKKPTLSNLSKEASKLNAKRKVEIGGFEFIINEHFQPLHIQKLLIDYLSIINELKSESKKLDTSDTLIYLTYVMYGLTLQYFSNIPFPNSVNHSTLVATVHNLINLDIFEELWNSYDANELQKLNAAVERMSKNLPQAQAMLGDLLTQSLINQENNEEVDIDGL
jgi:hypothetical protein